MCDLRRERGGQAQAGVWWNDEDAQGAVEAGGAGGAGWTDNAGWPGSAAEADLSANDPCLNNIGVSAGHWEGVGCVNGDVRHMYASPPLPPLPRSACLALRH